MSEKRNIFVRISELIIWRDIEHYFWKHWVHVAAAESAREETWVFIIWGMNIHVLIVGALQIEGLMFDAGILLGTDILSKKQKYVRTFHICQWN